MKPPPQVLAGQPLVVDGGDDADSSNVAHPFDGLVGVGAVGAGNLTWCRSRWRRTSGGGRVGYEVGLHRSLMTSCRA